jgi:hypothetical protein
MPVDPTNTVNVPGSNPPPSLWSSSSIPVESRDAVFVAIALSACVKLLQTTSQRFNSHG